MKYGRFTESMQDQQMVAVLNENMGNDAINSFIALSYKYYFSEKKNATNIDY